MKEYRRYLYLTEFERRLMLNCLMNARNAYLAEDKPIEDVDEIIEKVLDAPTKKLRVIEKEDTNGTAYYG